MRGACQRLGSSGPRSSWLVMDGRRVSTSRSKRPGGRLPNTRRYTAMLASLGLDTWGSETPAVPIVLGSPERDYAFWKALLEKGVFTVMAFAPAVPPGKDLIRTAISAGHTDEQLARIAEAMAYAAKKI